MKLKLFITLFSLLSISAYAQRITETIKSKKLNASREIQIILPKGYEEKKDEKFPLLVVLDADYLIAPVAADIRFGSNFDENPDFIIVGINQAKDNDRIYDSEFEDSGVPSVNGGAFFEFLGMEIIPYIESKYRVQPFRAIMGHGVTAAFLNAYLYKDTSLFNAYISLSPAYAKDMENVVANRLSVLKSNIFYYLATTDGDLKTDKDKTKTLDTNIKAKKRENINYMLDYYPNGNHYSYVTQAIPAAINFIFKGYSKINKEEFDSKIMILEKGHTDYLIQRYENAEKNFGFPIKMRLTDFEAIEAAIIKKGNYEDLPGLSRLADKAYPGSMLGAYHLALYEEKMEDWGRAEKAYMKAFGLQPIRNLTKNMMIERAEFYKGKLKEHTKNRKSKKNKSEDIIEESPSETTSENSENQ